MAAAALGPKRRSCFEAHTSVHGKTDKENEKSGKKAKEFLIYGKYKKKDKDMKAMESTTVSEQRAEPPLCVTLFKINQ